MVTLHRALIGFAIGVAVAALTAAISVLAAGGGHGTYLPAKLFFPFAMLGTLATGTITAWLATLALLQYPIYGLIVASTPTSRRRQALVAVAAVHAIAALVALSVLDDMWARAVPSTGRMTCRTEATSHAQHGAMRAT